MVTALGRRVFPRSCIRRTLLARLCCRSAGLPFADARGSGSDFLRLVAPLPDLSADFSAEDGAVISQLLPGASQVSLERMLDGLAIGVAVVSRDSVIQWCSADVTRLLGLTAGFKMDDAYLAALEVIDLAGARLTGRELYEQLAADGTDREVVRGLRDTTGARLWLRMRGTPIAGAGAERLGTVVSFANVTSLMSVSAERRALSERFETILREMHDGVFVVDEGGFISYANAAALRILGFSSPEEWVGTRYDLTPVRRFDVDGVEVPEDSAPIRKVMAGDDGTHGVLLRYEGFPRAGIWLRSALTPLPGDGSGRRAVVVTFADCTAEMQERALRARSEGLLGSMLTASPAGVVFVSAAGVIEYANAAAERVLGLRREGIEGRFATDESWERILADGRPMPLDQVPVAIVLRERRQVLGVEHGLRRGDGVTRWLRVNAAPVFGMAGELEGVVAEFTDVTEEWALRQQAMQADRVESVGRLASGVAHDFNNLLTVVLSAGDLALQKTLSGASVHEELAMIQDAAERGAALSRQLLAFSRRKPAAPGLLRLGELFEGLLPLLGRLLGEDVTVNYSSADPALAVYVGASQVEQLMVNLAINARHAMPDGGTLAIRVSEVQPSSLRREPALAPMVQIEVHDTGHGIAPEVLPHIFDTFFTTKPEGSGSGIGLTTCRMIVQAAGGTMTCESVIGFGTTFRIRLPRGESASPAAIAADAAVASDAKTITARVLVVEDEPLLRDLVLRVLSSAGVTTLSAGSVAEAEAVAVACGEPIDVVLTDVVLAEGRGPMVFEAVRQRHPGARALYMSGYEFRDDLSGAATIAKPFLPQALLRAVRDVLAP